MPTRRFRFRRDGVGLSVLDFGGPGRPLLALHGHFGCARNFAPLAAGLAPEWRVIALDQRGHGWSAHPAAAGRRAYVEDAAALIEHLGLGPLPVLGHSLGGVNAFQLAAWHPDLVSALIVEDHGADVPPVPPFFLDWPRRFETVSDLQSFLDAREIGQDRHFLDSLVEHEDGWGFRFDPTWIARSQAALAGDWTGDWRASSVPALLIRGTRSRIVSESEIRRMERLRPNTRVVSIEGGHTLHDEAPEAFLAAVRAFLVGLAA